MGVLMKLLYSFKTKVGVFYIGQSKDGRFHPIFDDETLGSYLTPMRAIDDLAGGHTFTPPGGFDTSRLGIPDDIGDWERIR